MRNYWRFVRLHWAILLFGFSCIFWGNFGQSFFLGWYGETIKAQLGMSARAYGAVYSLATLGGALALVWLGALIDRWPLRRYLLLTCAGLLMGCMLMAIVANPLVLCLGIFCLRLFGQGLFPHIGLTTMARDFTENRGKAISIAASGVPVGEIVLPVCAVFLILTIGWQNSWWVIAAATVVLMLPLAFFLLRQARRSDPRAEISDDRSGRKVDGGNTSRRGVGTGNQTRTSSEKAEPDDPDKKSGRRLLWGDRRFWLAAPALLASPFVLTAFFIHQDFVLVQKHWAPAWLASCFVMYGVTHWLSSMVTGVLVDRFSGRRLLRFYVLPLLAAIFMLANLEGAWVALVFMALIGVTQGASGPVVGSLWAEIYGASVLGGVRAAAGAFMVFSTAVSPWLFGLFIDAGFSLPAIYNGFGVTFSLAALLLRLSYR